MYATGAFPDEEQLAANLGVAISTLLDWRDAAKEKGDDWDLERRRLTGGKYLGPTWDSGVSTHRAVALLGVSDELRRACTYALRDEKLYFRAETDMRKGETVEVPFLYNEAGQKQSLSGIRPGNMKDLSSALNIASQMEERARMVLDKQRDIEERVSQEVSSKIAELISILDISPETAQMIMHRLFPGEQTNQPKALPEPEAGDDTEQADGGEEDEAEKVHDWIDADLEDEDPDED